MNDDNGSYQCVDHLFYSSSINKFDSTGCWPIIQMLNDRNIWDKSFVQLICFFLNETLGVIIWSPIHRQ
jgi:hypothetical protein